MFGLKRLRDDLEQDGIFSPEAKKICSQVAPESSDLDQTLRFRAPTLTPVDSSDDEDHQDASHGAHKTSPTKPVLGHRPPALQLNPANSIATSQRSILANGDELSPWISSGRSSNSLQPSPIPHNLVNQSLNLTGPASAAPAQDYFPSDILPVIHAPNPGPPNVMEGVAPSKVDPHTATVRLPSPVSDDDTMANGKTPPSDAEMMYFSPHPSSPPSFSGCPNVTAWTAPSMIPEPQSTRPCAGPLQRAIPSMPRKKPALVMGYRADCDKCRHKVPGHYSHIIR
ncbi:hypothetical protein NUU61_006985 [Penicillium alfredii]|uniref:Uncharacterized protein n=1 Tax=Penicillium alfredii TaxID=1506179 RepID=A0A9W9K450_9EURO|nr:uncharacterized protein NUU61_006985 [Penicillium alfredii]KAJ5092115.1 hypothetical protein NUU61_006985 [Penicillium alfredii]